MTVTMLHAGREFQRDQYGRPSVTSPDDLNVQLWYTRATTLAGTIADRFGVERWAKAQVAVGVGLRRDLAAAAVAFREDKTKLYELVAEAESAAAVAASATMGSVKHELSAQVHLGRAQPDEISPLVAEEVLAIVDLERRAFTDILGVEFNVVNDQVESAGSPDRLYRLPDGRSVIGDLKTGANALAYASQEIAVQLATYSHGVPYDVITGKRGSWPESFDPTIGMVVFAPSGQAPAVYQFDLIKGWEGAALAYYVRRYRKTTVHRPAESINPPF